MNTNTEDVTLKDEVDEEIVIADDASQEDKDLALTKLQETNKQLFARAKKAEGFTQDKDGKWTKPTKQVEQKTTVTTQSSNTDISQTDLYALIKADVPQEDISEVSEYAKLKGISITDALQAPIVKAILKEKSDERTASNASHTGRTTRTSTPTGDDLLEKAQRGDMPDKPEDIARLIRARKGIK